MRARILPLFLLALAISVAAPAAASNGSNQSQATGVLPFHAEVAVLQLQQVPVPAGRCTEPLPPGISYLWLTQANGTQTSTHLGTGPYHIELCVYGLLTDPAAPPPANGIPMGWIVDVQIFTAANGDQLRATGELIGFTAPPPTPGWQFVESLSFLDGGTGRFEHAEGTGQGVIEQTGAAAVYDGWIRYGEKEK